ncbi:hypothetical protein FRC01_004816 [Tulasnella sp. 417]|nr:hypothetical protein FRC01_004816 [Tulasnella sp. 417]
MAAERRVAAERVNPALTTKIKESGCAEVGNVVLSPLSPSMRRRTGPVVDGTRTTSACPPVSPRAPDLRDVSSKLLGGLPKEVRSGHLVQRQSPTRPSGRAIHRAADEANSIPTMRIEEPTPQSMRVKSYHYVYRPPTPPRASEFSIGVHQGEVPGPASIRAEAPVVFFPPRYPSSCRKSSNAVTAPAHRPGHRRTNPQAFSVSPRPLVGKIEEDHLPELRPAPTSGLRTSRSGPLKRDDVSDSLPVTQTAVHLARRNDQPNDGTDGSERSESGDSDDSDKTIRPSRIRFPSQSRDSEDRDRTPRASMILLPSGPRDSDQSGETSRASRVGVPSGFAAAAVQQAIQSGHAPARDIGRNGKTSSSSSTERTHRPTAFLRGPQQPQLGLRDRTPQVSETEIRGREPQDRQNIPTSRQVGLSTRDIWARQLEYRLEVSASIGDDRTYAAASQQALGAGFVIYPNHVLRRASALIPKDAALLPNNGASL